MVRERRRSVHFRTMAGAAMLLMSCTDRKASRAQLTMSPSATLGRPSANPVASTRAGPAPQPWGSDRLRFVGSNPECAALAAETTRQLTRVRDPFESSSPEDSARRVSAFQALIAEHTACVPSPGGSWATFFEGGADPRDWAWFVGFLSQSGAIAKHAGNFVDQIDERASHAAYTGKT